MVLAGNNHVDSDTPLLDILYRYRLRTKSIGNAINKKFSRIIGRTCTIRGDFRHRLIPLWKLLVANVIRYCQTCAAFSTTTWQYFATIFCRHSFAETMLVYSSSVRRLISSFHCILFFSLFQTIFFGVQNYKTISILPKILRVFCSNTQILLSLSSLINLILRRLEAHICKQSLTLTLMYYKLFIMKRQQCFLVGTAVEE